jgi:hypothetical protein
MVGVKVHRFGTLFDLLRVRKSPNKGRILLLVHNSGVLFPIEKVLALFEWISRMRLTFRTGESMSPRTSVARCKGEIQTPKKTAT